MLEECTQRFNRSGRMLVDPKKLVKAARKSSGPTPIKESSDNRISANGRCLRFGRSDWRARLLAGSRQRVCFCADIKTSYRKSSVFLRSLKASVEKTEVTRLASATDSRVEIGRKTAGELCRRQLSKIRRQYLERVWSERQGEKGEACKQRGATAGPARRTVWRLAGSRAAGQERQERNGIS